jgi:hypothetical protein
MKKNSLTIPLLMYLLEHTPHDLVPHPSHVEGNSLHGIRILQPSFSRKVKRVKYGLYFEEWNNIQQLFLINNGKKAYTKSRKLHVEQYANVIIHNSALFPSISKPNIPSFTQGPINLFLPPRTSIHNPAWSF